MSEKEVIAEVARINMEKSLTTLSSADGVFASHAAFVHYSQVAALFAQSLFVPKDFQGSMPNCLIALDLAVRMRENPLVVFQNLYVVHGRPGFTSKYMIARAKLYAGWKTSVRWDIEELEPKIINGFKNLSVTAHAVDENGERLEATVTMQMAIDDGWTKNAKYKSMPEQMLRWRSASQLINLYAPEVMLGIQIAEELEDESSYRSIADSGSESMASVLDRVAATMPQRVVVEDIDPVASARGSNQASTAKQAAIDPPKADKPAAPVEPPAALADLVQEVEKEAPKAVVNTTQVQQVLTGEPPLAKLSVEKVNSLASLARARGKLSQLAADKLLSELNIRPDATAPGCYSADEVVGYFKEVLIEALDKVAGPGAARGQSRIGEA
jgi:hypothetical protein